MVSQELLHALEELAHQLGMEVRYERLQSAEECVVFSGSCRIKQQKLILVEESSTMEERIQILRRALRQENLEAVFVQPRLREFLKPNA